MSIPDRHERRELREAIVAQLKGPDNDRTAAGERVDKSRLEPSKVATLPRISVYSSDESTESEASDQIKKRVANITIVGFTTIPDDSSELDDVLDGLALEIEAAMDLDPHLSTCATTSRYVSTEFGMQLEGARPLGAVSLLYECTYDTRPRTEDPPDRLETLTAATNLNGEQAPADRSNVTQTLNEGP